MEPRSGFEPGASSTPWLSYFFEPFIFGHKLYNYVFTNHSRTLIAPPQVHIAMFGEFATPDVCC